MNRVISRGRFDPCLGLTMKSPPRESNLKASAFAFFTECRQSSIPRFDDPIGSHQAQAGPFADLLGSEEGFEQVSEIGLGNATARIFDGE